MSLDDFNLHRSFRRKPAQMNKFRKKHIFLFQNFLPLASFLLKKNYFRCGQGVYPLPPFTDMSATCSCKVCANKIQKLNKLSKLGLNKNTFRMCYWPEQIF